MSISAPKAGFQFFPLLWNQHHTNSAGKLPPSPLSTHTHTHMHNVSVHAYVWKIHNQLTVDIEKYF